MGKVTGFLEIDRRDGAMRRLRPDSSLQGILIRFPRSDKDQAARAWIADSVLPQRLPGQQSDPGLDDLGISSDGGASRNLHSSE